MGAEQSAHNNGELAEMSDFLDGHWQCVDFQGDMVTFLEALGHKIDTDEAHFGLRNRRIKITLKKDHVVFDIMLSNGLEVSQTLQFGHADAQGSIGRWVGNALEVRRVKNKVDPRRKYYRDGDQLVCEVYTEAGLSVRQNYRRASNRKKTMPRLNMWS